ncbi:hypothetical protein ABPG75_013754 [Micractinium tetrahymenae]
MPAVDISPSATTICKVLWPRCSAELLGAPADLWNTSEQKTWSLKRDLPLRQFGGSSGVSTAGSLQPRPSVRRLPAAAAGFRRARLSWLRSPLGCCGGSHSGWEAPSSGNLRVRPGCCASAVEAPTLKPAGPRARSRPPARSLPRSPSTAAAMATTVALCSAVARPALAGRRSFAGARLQQQAVSLRAQRKAVAARAEATEGTQVDVDKVVKDLQEKWDKVENKTSVVVYGAGGIVVLWLASTIVGALNNIPLLPKLFELVGLGYSAWFTYRYLLFKSSREELVEDIESLKKKISE